MTVPHSLQTRLALSLGILLTVLWLAAAWVTGLVLRHEMDEVFDSSLQETAQRLLPLAVFAGVFIGLGGVAAWLARERLRSGTRLFSATVEELKQDREELRS